MKLIINKENKNKERNLRIFESVLNSYSEEYKSLVLYLIEKYKLEDIKSFYLTSCGRTDIIILKYHRKVLFWNVKKTIRSEREKSIFSSYTPKMKDDFRILLKFLKDSFIPETTL